MYNVIETFYNVGTVAFFECLCIKRLCKVTSEQTRLSFASFSSTVTDDVSVGIVSRKLLMLSSAISFCSDIAV